jgi:hypothetical protein
MPMYPVTFVTIPCHSDGSPDDSRKEGELTAYAMGITQQDAEDVARVWRSFLSDIAATYTPQGKPRRRLGFVRSNPYPLPPVEPNRIRANAFLIYPEFDPFTDGPHFIPEDFAS